MSLLALFAYHAKGVLCVSTCSKRQCTYRVRYNYRKAMVIPGPVVPFFMLNIHPPSLEVSRFLLLTPGVTHLCTDTTGKPARETEISARLYRFQTICVYDYAFYVIVNHCHMLALQRVFAGPCAGEIDFCLFCHGRIGQPHCEYFRQRRPKEAFEWALSMAALQSLNFVPHVCQFRVYGV